MMFPRPLRRLASPFIALAATLIAACSPPPAQACTPVSFDGAPYTVCKFDTTGSDIRLFLNDPDGAPYGQFDRLAGQLESEGKSLTFAMNGGMYHDDRRAVGLYVEEGSQLAPLVRSAGPGNFGMLPNGVFWLDGSSAGIAETSAYDARFPATQPRFATQSGPMLVLDGALHPQTAQRRRPQRRWPAGLFRDQRRARELPQFRPPLPRPSRHAKRALSGWSRVTSLRARPAA